MYKVFGLVGVLQSLRDIHQTALVSYNSASQELEVAVL